MVESHAERSRAAKKGARTRKRNEERKERTPRHYGSRIRSGYRKRVAKAKPIEMALFALLGYKGIQLAVDGIGADKWLYDNVKIFHDLKDKAGVGDGGSFVAKLVGTAVGADAGYKSLKSGKISNKALNIELPLALGGLLDPEPKTGSGSSSGRW